jgi:uncharacterized phage protein (TIGR01671 family)
MRQIKFRAWDKGKKKFLPDDCFSIINRTGFNAFGVMISDFEDYLVGEFLYDESQELTQFTGLIDKNGKEIYEGDIVSKIGAYVIWSDTIACWCFNFKDSETQDTPLFFENNLELCEVIGNIYENPELL